MNENDPELKNKIQAATFRRLVEHLQKNTDLQNIDLMNLAGFCRNCLSKWMVDEAKKINVDLEYDKVRNEVYGMEYSEWKKNFKNQLNELFNNWCSWLYRISYQYFFVKKKIYNLWP